MDLVITDIPQHVNANVHPKIADHAFIVATISFKVPQRVEVEREFWQFNKADWKGLNTFFNTTDWHTIVGDDVDTATAKITDYIISAARRFIPVSLRTVYKSTHPWVNKRCKDAVEAKRNAEGTPSYGDTLKACSEVILEEFNMYVARTREKMKNLPRGSKRWWTMSKTLASRSDKNSNVPPLKTTDKEWVMDAESKADLLLRTFTSKFSLILKNSTNTLTLSPRLIVLQIFCPYGQGMLRMF